MPRKRKGSKKGKERPSGRLGSRFGHVYADLPARGRSMTGGAAASSPSGAGAGAAPTYTPEDLAKKGEEMVLRLQPELAVEFFRRFVVVVVVRRRRWTVVCSLIWFVSQSTHLFPSPPAAPSRRLAQPTAAPSRRAW